MAKDRKDLKERKERLAKVNHWDELLALRDRQREQTKNAIQVVKESELPLEVNRQGLMRWYLHPSITDTILSTLAIYRQEIPPGSRSGRLKFQGAIPWFQSERVKERSSPLCAKA